MPTIKYNEKKKYYEVRYDAGYDGSGNRIQKYKGGFKRKSDAEDFLADQVSSVNKGTYIHGERHTGPAGENKDRFILPGHRGHWLGL